MLWSGVLASSKTEAGTTTLYIPGENNLLNYGCWCLKASSSLPWIDLLKGALEPCQEPLSHLGRSYSQVHGNNWTIVSWAKPAIFLGRSIQHLWSIKEHTEWEWAKSSRDWFNFRPSPARGTESSLTRAEHFVAHAPMSAEPKRPRPPLDLDPIYQGNSSVGLNICSDQSRWKGRAQWPAAS